MVDTGYLLIPEQRVRTATIYDHFDPETYDLEHEPFRHGALPGCIWLERRGRDSRLG